MRKKRLAAVILLLALAAYALSSKGLIKELGASASSVMERLKNPAGERLNIGILEEESGREIVPVPEMTMPPFPSDVSIPPTPRPESETEKEQIILPTTIEGGLVMNNATSYELDLVELLSEGHTVRLPKEGYQILIIHTHGSEAYSPDGTNEYKPTDNFRTDDKRYSVIRVGDELAACFESYGLSVLHDREIYDYPSYTGSYPRSGEAVEKYLAQHPEISVVLDVHRDAIGTGDIIYKTLVEDKGHSSSQIMLLVGTGENGLAHPNWRENLKFAFDLQSAVVDKYPTLARPVSLKKERYNQQLTKGSLIVEVGSSGNTLDEALRAIRLFADAVAPILLDLRQ